MIVWDRDRGSSSSATSHLRGLTAKVACLLTGFSKAIESLVRSIFDAIPPYRVSRGRVDAKGFTHEGLPFIAVSSKRIIMDRHTFDILSVGQRVKIRYTRTAKAIDIELR